MEYKYDINGTERTINIEGSGDVLQVTLDGKTYEISASTTGDGCLLMKVDGHTMQVRYARDEQGIHVMLSGLSIIAGQPGGGGAARQRSVRSGFRVPGLAFALGYPAP